MVGISIDDVKTFGMFVLFDEKLVQSAASKIGISETELGQRKVAELKALINSAGLSDYVQFGDYLSFICGTVITVQAPYVQPVANLIAANPIVHEVQLNGTVTAL